MDKTTRYITAEQRLIAFALFVTAKMNHEKVDRAEREMNEALGLENGSHFSDQIYGYDWTLPEVERQFDLAMKRENLKVLPPDSAGEGRGD